jgi:hypothetical protein
VTSSSRRNPKRDNKESTTHSTLASQEMLCKQHRQNWLHQNLPFPYHPMMIFTEIFTAWFDEQLRDVKSSSNGPKVIEILLQCSERFRKCSNVSKTVPNKLWSNRLNP